MKQTDMRNNRVLCSQIMRAGHYSVLVGVITMREGEAGLFRYKHGVSLPMLNTSALTGTVGYFNDLFNDIGAGI